MLSSTFTRLGSVARSQARRLPVAATRTFASMPPTERDPSRSSINAPTSYLSNVSNFKIIESTLREGEQFANAFFTTEKKIEIAKALADFGAKILTHVRCHMDDARLAVETGVDGLDVVIGTSSYLREFSHGKDMQYIIDTATEVIQYIKGEGLEVRFSSEDSFRSDIVDLLNLYRAVDKLGVNRVGIADTVGCASPDQVAELVRTLRGVVSCDIECHFHNDTGCAIANAYAALQNGATHVDTSVLGIGERNGIPSLGGFIARMYAADKEHVKAKYNLPKLREIENIVADAVGVAAILNNPSTYEILRPEDFGMTRYVAIGHRLTGWNAVKNRVDQLGLGLTDSDCKRVTNKIKNLADIRPLSLDDVDKLLRMYGQAMDTDSHHAILDSIDTPDQITGM
ncbi:homocitrate synthase lys21 [Coemansia sp. RSA 1853]|nr:homocitrate synthase lys21 [Coemansia sp. RSA 1853]